MSLAIQIGIIVLLCFAPLAFGSVEVWSRSILEAAAFGLAGLGLIRHGFGPDAPPKFPGLLWAILMLWAGWALFQWTVGPSFAPHATRDALLLGTAYAVIFALVVSTVRTEREIRRLVLSLIVIGFGLALAAVFQRYAGNGKIFGLREAREGGAIFGPFVNRNHFAGAMEMLIPLSIGYTVAAFAGVPAKGQTAWRRFIHRMTSEQANQLTLILFMTLVMSVALVLSLSRAGIVGFLSAVLLIGMILLFGRTAKKWILLPGVLVVVLLISLAWFGLGPLIDRYQTLLNLSEDLSMRGRIEVWKDAARILTDHPAAGTGLGTFGAVYPAYKTVPDQVFFEHAHNDYVQLAAETGLTGVGLILGGFGMILGFILAGWRARKNPRAKDLLMGVVTGLVAMLIHGINDFNFHIPANAAIFAALLGLAWNLSRPETADAPVPRCRSAASAAAGLAAVGLLLFQTATVFAADRYYQCGLEMEKAGRYEPAAEEYRRAIRWDAAHPDYRMALGRIYERGYLKGEASALASARSEIERAAALAPTKAEPHLHLGWIHAQRGDEAGATKAFQQVLRLDPTNNGYRHYVGLWFAAVDGVQP